MLYGWELLDEFTVTWTLAISFLVMFVYTIMKMSESIEKIGE